MLVSLIIEMDWSMTTVYMACAAGGGTLLILQTLLLLLGWGDTDVDLDADTDIDAGDGAFSLFSVRAVVSFFTFFGLTGWLGTARGWDPMLTVFAAAASGGSLMLVVGWLLAMQTKLESKGNLDPKNTAAVMAYLAEFCQEGGTVVTVTHGDAADDHANRILQLRAGQVVPPE